MIKNALDKLDTLTRMTEGKFDAFLYDCDGTLADNMHLHKAAYAEVASRYGIDLDTSLIDELAGWPTVKMAEEINRPSYQIFHKKRLTDGIRPVSTRLVLGRKSRRHTLKNIFSKPFPSTMWWIT